MAGDAVVGALRVVLGADTAALETGLKSAASAVTSFGKVASGAFAYLSPSIQGVVTSLGGQIKATIDAADHLNKMSQSTGLSTEELSKLKYAAELSDISTESLGKSMGKLSKAMVSAATDGAGGAAQAFNAMGVAVKNNDGTLRSQNEVLLDVAAKFQGYEDGAAKTALAISLFGKAGAAMIPLLNQGRDGLQEAGDEAEKFGLVLDKKTTMAAEAFNDNLKRMDLIKQGIVTTVTAKLLPSFEHFSELLLEAKQNSTFMSSAAEGLTNILKGIASAVLQVTAVFQGLFKELGAFSAAFKEAGGGFAGFKAGWAAMNAEGAKTEQMLEEVKKAVSNIWADVPEFSWQSQANDLRAMQKEVQAVASDWGKVAAPIVSSEAATKNALQSFLDSQAKRTASMDAEAATVGKSVGEQAKLRIAYEAQAIALAKGIPLTDAWKAQISAVGDAASNAAMKLQGMQLIDQTATPWDQRAQKVQQYTAAMMAAGASTEQLGIMNMQIQFPNFTAAANAAIDFGANLDRLATSSVTMLSSTLADVITGTKSAGEAFAAFAKQVLQQVAQMIVQLLIMKALKMSMGMFFSEGGGVPFAKGGIAAFAPGGSVHGPGSGTSDSIPAMLSAGEFVINAAAARQIGLPVLNALNNGEMPMADDASAVTPGAVQQSSQVKTVRVVTDEIGRPLVEKLINALNDAFRDGHKLVLQPA